MATPGQRRRRRQRRQRRRQLLRNVNQNQTNQGRAQRAQSMANQGLPQRTRRRRGGSPLVQTALNAKCVYRDGICYEFGTKGPAVRSPTFTFTTKDCWQAVVGSGGNGTGKYFKLFVLRPTKACNYDNSVTTGVYMDSLDNIVYGTGSLSDLASAAQLQNEAAAVRLRGASIRVTPLTSLNNIGGIVYLAYIHGEKEAEEFPTSSGTFLPRARPGSYNQLIMIPDLTERVAAESGNTGRMADVAYSGDSDEFMNPGYNDASTVTAGAFVLLVYGGVNNQAFQVTVDCVWECEPKNSYTMGSKFPPDPTILYPGAQEKLRRAAETTKNIMDVVRPISNSLSPYLAPMAGRAMGGLVSYYRNRNRPNVPFSMIEG